jgi:hypothetical protein
MLLRAPLARDAEEDSIGHNFEVTRGSSERERTREATRREGREADARAPLTSHRIPRWHLVTLRDFSRSICGDNRNKAILNSRTTELLNRADELRVRVHARA